MPDARRVAERLKDSRPYEAWQRYTTGNGNLLSAGVGYYAFFSIFPALALAFAIFGFVLQGRPDLVEAIADSLNKTLPGMVKTPTNPTGLISIEAPSSLTLTVTGVISFVTLLYAGLGWIGALRTGIRGIFGLDKSDSNFALTKARDLLVLATLGLGVAVSAILTSAIGGFAERVADWIGLTGNGVVVGVLGVAVGVVFDTLIMVLLLRVLSEVPLPWHNVRDAAVLGAVALTVLKLLGGFLIGRATSNPVLGAVAVSVGLLFWLNLISRVVLLSAAFAANHVEVARLGEPAAPAVSPDAAAEPVLEPDPSAEPAGAGQRSSATRSVDRVSVVAGAAIGAAATAAATAALRLRRPRR